MVDADGTEGIGNVGKGDATSLVLVFAVVAACLCADTLASFRRGDFSGRNGRAAACEGVVDVAMACATGGREGDIGVLGGLSSSAGLGRIGRVRNAGRPLSVVGEDGDPVGEGADVPGVERAGDINGVDFEGEGKSIGTEGGVVSISTLTTSQPSIDSEVADEESEDDMMLPIRLILELREALGNDCARACSRSRSLPFKDPNKRLTPKLSLRLIDLTCGGADMLLLSLLWANAVVRDSVTLLAHALGIL